MSFKLDFNQRSQATRFPYLFPWGPDLTACSIYPNAAQAQRVCIFDLGSNSAKQAIFDRGSRSLATIGKWDVIAGLASGMAPGDPLARLNRDGVQLLRDELPAFKDQQVKLAVDTVVVVGTEAMRRYAHGFPAAAADVCSELAERMNVPVQAFNVIDDDVEAHYAAVAASIENPYEEMFIMMGGGSTEIGHNPRALLSKAFRATLSFGSQNLKDRLDAGRMIFDGFSNVPFFKPLNASQFGVFGFPNETRGSLLAMGGTLRPVGRMLAQEAGIPFFLPSPYGGRRFVCDGILLDRLKRLSQMTPKMLKAEYREWDIRAPKIDKQFHDQIFRRAEAIPVGAQALLVALECLSAHELVFSRNNMREVAYLMGLPGYAQKFRVSPAM